MSTIIRQPTANQTPDAGQGGAAVGGISNSGHTATVVTAPAGTGFKTARWFTFESFNGLAISAKLRVTWTVTGLIGGIDADNVFQIDYTLNGGGAWNNLVFRSTVTSPDGATTETSIPVNQDVAQVQVRDSLQALSGGTDSASLTASISTIELVFETIEGQVIVVM